ncbi:MAG: carbohydrate ABC transporter permease [Oscillospiraceae bacterium]|nr:carbohydrate ABC transporter permease [Oscillospiraceae bacterium]
MIKYLEKFKKQPLTDDEEYNAYVRKKKLKAKTLDIGIKIFRAILIIGICYYILYPLIAKLFSSFMAEIDVYDTTVGMIPRNWTLINYERAWKGLNYLKSFFSTLGLTILNTVCQIAACTLVGYGFARFKFPLKGLLFGMVIFTLLVPPTTIIIPTYLNFRFFDIFGIIGLFNGGLGINLTDSIWSFVVMGVTCMGFKNGLYIFMVRQFFRGVPKELEEAALIDGANHLRTFWSVMLPSAKPILTVVSMFSIVWSWTDTFYQEWFLKTADLLANKLTVLASTVANEVLGGSNTFDDAYANIIKSSGIILVILPLIIFYIFAQKQFVEGIERSGIVG